MKFLAYILVMVVFGFCAKEMGLSKLSGADIGWFIGACLMQYIAGMLAGYYVGEK